MIWEIDTVFGVVNSALRVVDTVVWVVGTVAGVADIVAGIVGIVAGVCDEVSIILVGRVVTWDATFEIVTKLKTLRKTNTYFIFDKNTYE